MKPAILPSVAFVAGFALCAGLSALADHVEVSRANEAAAKVITSATDDLLRCGVELAQCRWFFSRDPRTWRKARELR